MKWKLKVKFTKIRVICGIVMVFIHWGLFIWMKNVEWGGLPGVIDYILILPTAPIIITLGQFIDLIFPDQPWGHACADFCGLFVFLPISSTYVFFLGMLIGSVIEYLIDVNRKK